jgi:glycosyltransferase involved in cell wall biosynthesis/LmbE family N-acetylglucosaminyl deacetylase
MNVVLLGLADALTAAGHEVELLTRATSETAMDARTPGGALVRHLEAGPRASVVKAALPAHVAEFGERMRGLRPFDVVHSHYWLSGAAALPVAQEWGVPHVLSLHTVAALKNERLAPGDAPEPAARVTAERMLVQASELTVTLSAAERDAVLSAYGARPERVRVVAPGVDTHLFHPAPSGGVETSARPVVLVLARIQPLKGVDLAIEAFAQMLHSRAPGRERPLLEIAGGTSPGQDAYAASLRRRVEELGLGDDIRFLPARSRVEAAALLRDAAVLLVPSHSETFGLVALEAAASGTPVVAAAGAGGLAEAVVDGVTGVLVADRQPESWAGAIGALVDDDERRARISVSAAERARSRGWGPAAAELVDLVTAVEPDPTAVFGDRPVFLHAHPDDESISTGGTLAALRAAGRTPVLLTGTRGERGEVVPGDLHHLEATEELGPHRVGELRSALDELGGVPQSFLGAAPARADGRAEREYSDSGMAWGPAGFAVAAEDAALHSLSLAPLAEVVDDVLAGIRALLPGGATSIIGYDALGGYGHPDHVRMHDAGVEAAARLGIPYLAIVEPRVQPASGADGPALAVSVPLDDAALAAKARAMGAHATQLTLDGDDLLFTLSGGQTHPVERIERYRLMP